MTPEGFRSLLSRFVCYERKLSVYCPKNLKALTVDCCIVRLQPQKQQPLPSIPFFDDFIFDCLFELCQLPRTWIACSNHIYSQKPQLLPNGSASYNGFNGAWYKPRKINGDNKVPSAHVFFWRPSSEFWAYHPHAFKSAAVVDCWRSVNPSLLYEFFCLWIACSMSFWSSLRIARHSSK